MATVWSQDQEVNISTIHRIYTDFISYAYTHLHVCDTAIFTCIALSNEPHNQKTPPLPWDTFMFFFHNHTHPLSSTPNPWQTPDLFFIFIILLFHGCVTWVESYSLHPFKTGCFFTQHNFLKFHPSYTYQCLIPFYCWIVIHGMDIPQVVWPLTYWKMFG